MKKKVISLLTVLVMMLTLGLTACGDNAGVYYAVTFNLNGAAGTAPAMQSVRVGDKVDKPDEAARKGYVFTGWYKEANAQIKWNFETDIVTEELTLYAGWSTYTVSFDLGEADVDYASSMNGIGKISAPVIPIWDGHRFTGWYKDAGCTNFWIFETDEVTENMTLYAGWVKQFKIEYDLGDWIEEAPTLNAAYADSNKLIHQPTIAERENYHLIGWYTTSDYSTQWNFAIDRVYKNMILYARWIKSTEAGMFNVAEAEGEVTIISLTTEGKVLDAVVFPNEINGHPVTAIGNRVFHMNKNIKSIQLGDHIKKIGSLAFADTPNLIKFIFNGKIEEIGEGAFKSQNSITEMTIPSSIKKIGMNAFSNSALEKITFAGGSNVEFGRFALANNLNLTDIIMPDGITNEIPDNFAEFNPEMNDIIVPEGVTKIGDSAYSLYNDQQDKKRNVSLPSTLKTIGRFAFSLQTFSNIFLPEGLVELGSSSLEMRFLEEVVIPAGITVIPDHCFSGSENLRTVTFLGNIERIEDSAFRGCPLMSEVTLPSSVKYIGNRAFSSNGGKVPTGVTVLNFDAQNLEYMGGNVFWFTPYQKNLVADANGLVIYDGRYLTEYRGAGGEVIIPDGVEGITAYTFQRNNALTSVSIPQSARYIGERAFSGILENEYLPSAYSNSNLSMVTFRGTSAMTSIEKFAFRGIKVTSFAFPEGVKKLTRSVLAGSANLLAVTLPEGINFATDNTTDVSGMEVFANCIKLNNVRLPESVNMIKRSAFEGCSALANITYAGAALTDIGDKAFKGTAFTTTADAVPTSVRKVGNEAFMNCSKLATIENRFFDGSVTLGRDVFANTAWELEGKEEIANFIFEGDKAVLTRENTVLYQYQWPTTVTADTFAVPENIVELSEGVFSTKTQSKILTLILPSTLKKISNLSLRDMAYFTTLIIHSEVPPVFLSGSPYHPNHMKEFIIYVPDGSLEAYQNSSWGTTGKVKGIKPLSELPA